MHEKHPPDPFQRPNEPTEDSHPPPMTGKDLVAAFWEAQASGTQWPPFGLGDRERTLDVLYSMAERLGAYNLSFVDATGAYVHLFKPLLEPINLSCREWAFHCRTLHEMLQGGDENPETEGTPHTERRASHA